MISIETLQELSDAVWTSKAKPVIRYNNESAKPKYKIKPDGTIQFAGFNINNDTLNTKRTYAHAHTTPSDTRYRNICFSWKGLSQSNLEVLETLAHELAHLKVPKERHDSTLFKYYRRVFQLDLVRVIINQFREMRKK